ncbi:hypothetical protein BG004_006979 [Podila humilis]|nr:hypothetical protein BG004_006979 [Podila humilis]
MLRVITTSTVRTLRPIRASSALVRRAYTTENAFKEKERATEEIYIRAKEHERLKAKAAQSANPSTTATKAEVASKEMRSSRKAHQKTK